MTFSWPRACSAEPLGAGFKNRPDDFFVSEDLAFEPSGTGEHLLLHVRKRGLATPAVAEALADAFAVPESSVGYAGMKDKHAVAEQWFSVATIRDADDLPPLEGVEILASARHARKLRRGELAGNRFEIRLVGVPGDGWERGLETLARQGAPNYFGPQRFGRDNLQAALSWLPERRRRRISRFKAGLYLSVARSFLFNEVLAARVLAGNWNRLVDGDVGEERATGWEPTGPLWGRGRSGTGGEARELEEAALAGHTALLDALEHAGLTQQRRTLVLRPESLAWRWAEDDLIVGFRLPPGCYATSLLREVFCLRSPGVAQL